MDSDPPLFASSAPSPSSSWCPPPSHRRGRGPSSRASPTPAQAPAPVTEHFPHAFGARALTIWLVLLKSQTHMFHLFPEIAGIYKKPFCFYYLIMFRTRKARSAEPCGRPYALPFLPLPGFGIGLPAAGPMAAPVPFTTGFLMVALPLHSSRGGGNVCSCSPASSLLSGCPQPWDPPIDPSVILQGLDGSQGKGGGDVFARPACPAALRAYSWDFKKGPGPGSFAPHPKPPAPAPRRPSQRRPRYLTGRTPTALPTLRCTKATVARQPPYVPPIFYFYNFLSTIFFLFKFG